ncbi:MFS transporter [Klugiella xanthotipulae]|uniref:Sugar phosphate permease n=1 Tax=Klugiella xanthotipulae TaxID=244735 RepID=A0A543HY94_9MICO|nr:MFS transporter [Klugiella xanthotipulae]TQM63283.1 sugar phosphate permease [Klugiella xanthotipulae]
MTTPSAMTDAQKQSATPPTEPWNTPITKKTITQVSIICFIAWVASVYDYTLFGTLLPVIADDFGWSSGEATMINTFATVGVFIVSLVVGTILDRLGRKRALILLMIGGAVASGLTGAVIGAVSLIIVRAFSGFSMSEEVVNAVYLNEIYKKAKSRGFMFSLVQSGWPVGALLSAGLSAILLPIIGWRWSFVFAAVLSLIVVALASRLPESPTFAAMKEVRRRREAGDVDGATALAAEHDLEEASHYKTGVKDVFTKELRKNTIFLSLAWFFNWVAIQVFSVLGTTVLVEAKAVSFDNALLILVAANAVGFLGYLAHGWVGDRLGRKLTVTLGWVLGGLSSMIMLFGPSDATFVISFYALTLFFLTGPYAALLFHMGESFPAHVRGMGTNVAHVMAPVGGIAGSFFLGAFLLAGVDMMWAAFFTGSLGLFASGLCMLGTRTTNRMGDHKKAQEDAA